MTGAEIAAIGGLLVSVAQMGVGIAKEAKAKKARKNYRPPEALTQSLALAKIQASDPLMPGYNQAKGNIDANTANALMAASRLGGGQQSVQSIAAGQNAAYRNLAQMNEESQYRDYANLSGQLGNLANAQDMMYQINTFGPAADMYREGRDMTGAGLQNAFGALSTYSGNLGGARRTSGQPSNDQLQAALAIANAYNRGQLKFR